MENEIEVGEYCRTSAGKIFKCSEIVLGNIPKDENKTMIVNYIVKHSPNLIDLIEVGDILITEYGKYEVIFDESYEKLGILIPNKKELAVRHSALEYVLNEFKEVTIVAKEMMESISYKVERN